MSEPKDHEAVGKAVISLTDKLCDVSRSPDTARTVMCRKLRYSKHEEYNIEMDSITRDLVG
jgi:hypothetical protein